MLNTTAFGGVSTEPKSLVKSALKKYHTEYDAPPTKARNISQDYPLGPRADDTGRLTASIDGAPLHASFIAGRRSLSGGDQGLSAEQIVDLAKALTGDEVSAVSQQKLGRDVVGLMGRPDLAGVRSDGEPGGHFAGAHARPVTVGPVVYVYGPRAPIG